MPSPSLNAYVEQQGLVDLSSFFRKSYDASAAAATESIKTTTATILLKGRLNIQQGGGFKGPWISGLQARQYPKGKNSPNAKSFINHKFGGLASVFEFGASIRPKRGKYLWILADGAPARMTLGANFGAGWINKTRGATTPQRLSKAFGGLEYAKSKRGFPMLGVTVKSGNRSRFKPYFIGIPFANIEKRWSVIEIATAEAENLVPRFLSAFDKANP